MSWAGEEDTALRTELGGVRAVVEVAVVIGIRVDVVRAVRVMEKGAEEDKVKVERGDVMDKYQPITQDMIDDVFITPGKVIPDDRGRLGEIIRCDDFGFVKFGQVYFTTTYPGVVKAWHMHKKQFDIVTCIKGMIKLVLVDKRDDSHTRDNMMEIYMGEHNPMVVRIPPGVVHGWKCVSVDEAYIVNVVSEPYDYKDPDEYRIDPNSDEIPYSWKVRAR